MLKNIIIELWHISRTALANSEYPVTRYDRMIYIKNELIRSYSDKIGELKGKKLWFEIEEALSNTPIN